MKFKFVNIIIIEIFSLCLLNGWSTLCLGCFFSVQNCFIIGMFVWRHCE